MKTAFQVIEIFSSFQPKVVSPTYPITLIEPVRQPESGARLYPDTQYKTEEYEDNGPVSPCRFDIFRVDMSRNLAVHVVLISN